MRRSRSVTGVDGLEPGQEYEVGLDQNALRSVRWVPVAKEDILLDRGYNGPGGNLDDYPWITDRPVAFLVRKTRLKIADEDHG